MTAPATMFVTYLWHYLVARLIYDGLLRPAAHGRPTGVLCVLVAMAVCALVVHHTRMR